MYYDTNARLHKVHRDLTVFGWIKVVRSRSAVFRAPNDQL